jgi:hypothetical protein
MQGTSPSRGARAVAGFGIEVPRWEVRTLIKSPAEGEIVFVGIDLAKNDAADAAAICEAVQRARQGSVAQRSATLYRVRGLLAELGIVLPQKAATACAAHPPNAHWLTTGLFRAFRFVARVYPGDATRPAPELPSVALNADHVRGLRRSAA